MNFRVLATRLKESASEVALKIPTFDDMAAKDAYIHSDDTDDLYDFNIPRKQQQQQQQDGQRGMTRNGSANPTKNTEEQKKPSEPHPSIQSSWPHHKSQQQQQPETLPAGNEGDETSSHGSGWSLLDRDRRGGRASPVIPKSDVLLSPLASTIPSAQQQQQQQQKQLSPMPSQTSIRKKLPQTSLPILSAVADALLDDLATSRRDDTSVSMMSDSSSDDHDKDDDDTDDDDPILSMIRKSQPENNFQTKKPRGIKEKQKQLKSSVSSISSASLQREHPTPFQQVHNQQQQQHHSTNEENVRLLQDTDERRSSWSSRGSYHDRSDSAAAVSDEEDFRTPQENGRKKKKNPQRFLNDLDQRLSSTPEPSDIESGEATNVQSLSSSSNLVVNRLGGWVKTIAASGNVDQWLGRTPTATTTQEGNHTNLVNTNPLSWMTAKFRDPPSSSQQQQQQQNRPPLARLLPKVATTGPLAPENDFSVTNSTSIALADNELAQLAQFKTRASTMWDMMVTLHTWMKENRQFAFIGATMLLAAFVYFYKGAASVRQN
jgi:hypothetical protein